MKKLAYILSFTFIFSLILGGHSGSLNVNIHSEKTERKAFIHMDVPQISVSIFDVKFLHPLNFSFKIEEVKAYKIIDEYCFEYFIDKYLKVLLIYIISPHAP